ncbi:DNA polymerase III subunit delta [bacterium]|nr:DNA polymerase III subunit delta [bacterium]
MAVYFFYGDEDFNIDLEIEDMKSALNQDFIAMNFQTLDNPEYPELITALRTPPMMFGDMLVVINSDKYFSSQKNFFDDAELEDIEDALKNNPQTLNIVFVVKLAREDGKKLDTRRKLYKILSKFNSKEFPAFKSYKLAEISAWVKQRAKKKDLSINDDAAELLIEQIGTNLRQFDGELDKLKLMAYPQKTVTKKMVEEIAISNQDLFNITELIMKNEKDKALLEFKKLTDKKHPLEILAAVQTMLRKWIILRTKSSLSTFELSKLTGQHEFVVKQTIAKLKNTKASDLVRLKQNLFEVECRIKSAEALDIISEVEIALIR